jgi:pyruvate/2-oxoglutarate/acetoin dehydrogenase E1 component
MEKAFDSLDAPIQRVAAANLPIAGGLMEQYILPQPKDIVAAVEAVIS